MGIIDIKFNKINTNLAISCLDSSIKIYDIDTSICFSYTKKDKYHQYNVKLCKIENLIHWK